MNIKKLIKRYIFFKKNDKQVSTEEVNCLAGATVYGDKSNITVGEFVTLSGTILYANESILVGDYTMIAVGTIIHTSTHSYSDHPMWQKRIDRPVKIGSHVWIGTGSIILPGVIINDYAVIGAGSVVSSNIPEGAIVGGNPARIIKHRSKEIYLKEMSIFDPNVAEIVKDGYLNISAKNKE